MAKIQFIKTLEYALKKKNIFCSNSIIHISNSQQTIFLKLFIRRKKINFFKKKSRRYISSGIIIKKAFLFSSKLFTKTMQQTLLKCEILRINLLQLRRSVRVEKAAFFKNFLRFRNSLFARRDETFFDFIYIVNLVLCKKVKTRIFLLILAEVFSVILKQKHGLYLFFVKSAIKYIITARQSSVLGIAFWISGKLKGKPRANIAKMHFGLLPKQTVTSNIDYSKIHAYNRYGAFGLKLWINTNKKN